MRYTALHKALDNWLVFLLLMSTGGLLFVFNRNIMYLLFFSSLLFTFLFLGQSIKRWVLNAFSITLLLLLMLFGLNYYFAFAEQDLNNYAYFVMVFSSATLTYMHFINNRNKEFFLITLHKMLKWITIHAFVSFVIYFFVAGHLSRVSSTYHESDTFMHIFFYNTREYYLQVFGLSFPRNHGLFWEAGVLQGFVNMFFFLHAFVLKRKDGWLLLAALVVFTTYSTVGIPILLLQGFVYFSSVLKRNKLLAVLGVIIMIPLVMLFKANLEEKMFGEKEASFQKRLFDLTQPFFIALEHPLTGIGLDIEQFQKYRYQFYINSSSLGEIQETVGIESKSKGSEKGSSNSVLFLLAAMGFPTFFFLMYMLFKQEIVQQKKWLLLTIILLSVMSEPLLLRPYFFVFMISGIIRTTRRMIDNKRQIA